MIKYEYSYEVETKDGAIITNRMLKGKVLLGSSERKAKRTLKFYFPGCKINYIKTKSLKHIGCTTNVYSLS